MKEDRKKEILKNLTPYLTIKQDLKMMTFRRALIENLIILLIWFSTIYKQDVYSFILFIMLIYYSYKRSNTALFIVRTTILLLIFVQYISQVVDFSSYNSRQEFPKLLTGTDTSVYPNSQHFYLKIPIFISMRTDKIDGVY